MPYSTALPVYGPGTTIMEKSKAQGQVKTTNARFYKIGWFFHFKHALAKYTDEGDELLITTASIGTRRAKASLRTR